MKNSMTVFGAVLTFFGVIFALQGFNVLGGSAMSNTTTWSILGPVIALVGVALMVTGRRKRSQK